MTGAVSLREDPDRVNRKTAYPESSQADTPPYVRKVVSRQLSVVSCSCSWQLQVVRGQGLVISYQPSGMSCCCSCFVSVINCQRDARARSEFNLQVVFQRHSFQDNLKVEL